MDALQITKTVVIVIIFLVNDGNNSTIEEFTAPFMKCGQEDMGNKAGVRGATYFTTCATFGGSKAKYCVFQCTSEKLGYIDSKKKQISDKNANQMDDDLNGYLAEHKLKHIIYNCSAGVTFDKGNANRCKTYKKFYYCAKNGLYAACNNYTGPPKYKITDSHSSEEDMGLMDVVDEDVTL